MRYNFRTDGLLQVEPIWEFPDDDQNNKVYRVFFDTLVKGEIHLYILFQNATLRKFIATIPANDKGEYLSFSEHPYIYNLESTLSKSGKGKDDNMQGGGDGKNKVSASSAKKVNLLETPITKDVFIANQILYSQMGIVDLKALLMENKMQIGLKIKNMNDRIQ